MLIAGQAIRRSPRRARHRAAATSPRTFVSMATRHPDGTDAEYLHWHTLDHRPEQHRLSAVRASLRLVSTPRVPRGQGGAARPFRRRGSRDDLLLRRRRRLDGFLDAVRRAGRCRAQTATVAARRAWRLRGAEQSRRRAGQGRRRRAAVVAGPGVYLLLETHEAPHGRAARGRRAWPESGRWPHSTSVQHWRAPQRGSNSPTASSTTTRSPPRRGCGPCSRSVGEQRTSNRCSPHRFTPSCRTSGTAMCRNRRRSCE